VTFSDSLVIRRSLNLYLSFHIESDTGRSRYIFHVLHRCSISQLDLLWRAKSKFHKFLLLSITFSLFFSHFGWSDSSMRGLTRVASMVHTAQKELASASATHTQDAFAVHLFSKSPRETIILERTLGGIYC